MKYRFINRLLNARGTESKRRRIKKNDYTNNTNSTSTFRILEQSRHQNGCERFESVARENIYTRILREQKWRVSIYVSLWINQLRFVIRRWNNKIPYRLQTRFEIRIHEKKIISRFPCIHKKSTVGETHRAQQSKIRGSNFLKTRFLEYRDDDEMGDFGSLERSV